MRIESEPNEIVEASSVKFRMALVTNSVQVRVLDESFACSTLSGHTDIVLAVDASPDGYFFMHFNFPHSLCKFRSRREFISC